MRRIASHGLTREGPPRDMSGHTPAQGAPPPQVAGLLCKNHWFLHEARWAGQDARIQRFKLGLADVLVPDFGVLFDKALEQLRAVG